MELARPLCRNTKAHPAHGFWAHGYTVWNECPGQSEHDADITVLAERMSGIARDAAWPLRMPAGIRLECHPSVFADLRLMFVPDYAEFTASLATGEDLFKPQIPVVVTAGMGRGAWRLAGDGGTIDQGTIREPEL